MRLLILAAAALAAPAAAAPPPGHNPADEEIARSLPSPGEVEAAGAAVDRVLGALMDVQVGPLLDAADPEHRAGRHHGDETLGDLARRDDPYFEERMHHSVGATTAGVNDIVARLAVLAPALRHSIEEIERSVYAATRDLPERDDY